MGREVVDGVVTVVAAAGTGDGGLMEAVAKLPNKKARTVWLLFKALVKTAVKAALPKAVFKDAFGEPNSDKTPAAFRDAFGVEDALGVTDSAKSRRSSALPDSGLFSESPDCMLRVLR